MGRYLRLDFRIVFETVLALGMVLVFNTGGIAKNFDSVFEWIDKGRKDVNLEIKIERKSDSFTFLRDAQQNLIVQEAVEWLFTKEEALPQSILKKGGTGERVDRLTQGLIELGYRVPKNSFFDIEIEDAVKDFQQSQRIAVDGIVGPETWARILVESRVGQFPIVKRRKLGNDRLSVEMKTDRHETLEKRSGGSQPIEWRLKWHEEIETFPNEAWRDFLLQALDHGLIAFYEIQGEPEPRLFLSFQTQGPTEISTKNGALTLTNTWYEHMRVSPRFAPRSTQDGRVVILIHDPHTNLEGQFQLIRGLKEFHLANQHLEFIYLEEGSYFAENRILRTSQLLGLFSNDVSPEVQVFNLTRKFLVDGPLAYRVLYGSDIPTLVTDELEVMSESPIAIGEDTSEAELSFIRDFYKRYAKLETELLIRKLENSSNKTFPEFLKWKEDFLSMERSVLQESQNLHHTLTHLVGLMELDVQRVTDEEKVNYLEELREVYENLAESRFLLLRAYNDRKFFQETASRYEERVTSYKNAFRRSIQIASSIKDHFQGQDKERTPMVFIGNFSTDTLIKNLPKKTGYIVFEPRVHPFTQARWAKDNLRKAISSGSNRSDQDEQTEGVEKVPVSPELEALQRYSTHNKVRVAKVKAQKESFLTTSPLDSPLTNQLWRTLERHPQLGDTTIRFEEQATETQGYEEAFVSVVYNTDGTLEELVLYTDRIKEFEVEEVQVLGKLLFFPPRDDLAPKTTQLNISTWRNTLYSSIWDGRAFHVLRGKENLLDAMTNLPSQSSAIHSLFY